MTSRADVALVARGLAPSRERAQALILAGRVYVDERKILKASESVMPDDNLLVRGEQSLSPRAQLEKALDALARM